MNNNNFETDTHTISRRAFVTQLEVLGAACLLPTVLASCASVRYAKTVTENERIVVPRAELSTVGTALIETPDDQLPLFLKRINESEFIALSTKCTHRGCQVESAGNQLVCPCHGSEFSLTGQRTKGPAEKPLTRFAVTFDERNLYVSRKPVPE
ncbi:MAG: Rieske (2Fe-2S) protein [Gemmatimonadaceae bacterium]